MTSEHLLAFLVLTVVFFILLDVITVWKLRGIRHTLLDTASALDVQTHELEALRQARANPLMIQGQKQPIIIEITPAGDIVSTNDYAMEFFARTKEEVIGRNIIGFLIPESSADGDSKDLIEHFCENPRMYVDM
jgi:PAS domain-containing protein